MADEQKGSRQVELHKESTEANYQYHHDTCASLVDRIYLINYKLIQKRQVLMDIQPRTVGSITLEFKNCSTHIQRCCGGCPHPRFKQWFNPKQRNSSNKHEWGSSEVKYPLKALPKKGLFTECWVEIRTEIIEIQILIKERSRLLKYIGAISKALNYGTKI